MFSNSAKFPCEAGSFMRNRLIPQNQIIAIIQLKIAIIARIIAIICFRTNALFSQGFHFSVFSPIPLSFLMHVNLTEGFFSSTHR